MNLEAIRIAIDTGELEKAKKLLGDVETQAKKTDKGVSGLTDSFFSFKGVIASISSVQLATQFIKTADAMNNLDSRLKLATKSTADYNKESQRLVEIAKGSYTSISDTMTLFTKLNPALEKNGANLEQVNRVVETFQKGLQLGGASAQESSSAILQFAQAMGSGVLRGEEFNAMAEASPKLMEYLAKGLEVPVTSLRKMAENGELTAVKVSNAMIKVSTDVDSAFSTMPVTVGKATTNLITDLSLLTREVDKATGATQSIANGILGISNSISSLSTEELSSLIELIKNGATAFGLSAVAAIGTKKAIEGFALAMETATSKQKLLSLAMSPNPYILAATAITLIATSMSNASKEAEILTNTMSKNKEELAKLAKNQLNYRKELLEEEAIKARLGYADAKAILAKDGISAKDKADAEEKIKHFNDTLQKLREVKSVQEDQSKQTKNEVSLIEQQAQKWKELPLDIRKTLDPLRVIRDEYEAMRKTLKDAKNDTPENLAKINAEEAKAIANETKKLNADNIKQKKDEAKAINDLSKEYSDFAKLGLSEYDKKLMDIGNEYTEFISKGGDVVVATKLMEDATKRLNEEQSKKDIEERNKAIDKQLAYDKSIFELKEKQVGLLDDENEKNRTLSQLYHDRQVQEIKAMAEKEPRNDDFYQKSLQYEDELLQKNLQRYSVTGQIIEEVGSGMKSTMMDFFDYTSAGFGNMRKMVIDVGNMIYQAIVKQMVVNPLVSAATSAVGAYFATPTATPSTGGGTYNGVTSSVITPWQGGISNGVGMQKFATGYLAGGGFASYDSKSNDTIPALISKGEAVIPASVVNNNRELIGALINSRGTTKFADGYVANPSSGAIGNVKVEIKNESGEQLKVSNATTRQDMEGTVISIILNAVQTNKMGMRTALGGR